MLRPAALILCAAFAVGFAAEGTTKAPAIPSDDQIAAAIGQVQDTLNQGRPASVAIDGRLFSVARSAGGRIALVPAYGAPIQLTTVSANGTTTITAITANGQTRQVQIAVNKGKKPQQKDEELIGGNDVAGGDAGGGLTAGVNAPSVPPSNAQPPASPR